MPKRMKFDVKANDKIKKSQDNADRISSFKKADYLICCPVESASGGLSPIKKEKCLMSKRKLTMAKASKEDKESIDLKTMNQKNIKNG